CPENPRRNGPQRRRLSEIRTKWPFGGRAWEAEIRDISGWPFWALSGVLAKLSAGNSNDETFSATDCLGTRGEVACAVCGLSLEQPCWFCIDCFTSNEVKKLPTPKVYHSEQHSYLHALVRCKAKECESRQQPTDERTTALEHEVGALSQKIETLDNTLQGLKSGLGRMEGMMAMIASKMSGTTIAPSV
ncbi:hypothetical protein PHLCEN_2v12000, partial [Hermanssonia centrifuga]